MWKKLRLLLFWTLAYSLAAALFFYILFDFQIWSDAAWQKLARAHIRGISGLAFGTSLAAAIPVYLAAVKYIWKTGKLPLNLSTSKPKAKSKSEQTEVPTNGEPKHVLPEDLPDELKEPYIRFHSGLLAKNAIDFVQSRTDLAAAKAPEIEAPGAFMPIPESFDAPSPAAEERDAPVFRDMDFGQSDRGSNPLEIATVDGKEVAIYTFDDPDFWVADDEDNWFATGKQIESPINILLGAKADEKILILNSKNIMNLEQLMPEWENKGIKVQID